MKLHHTSSVDRRVPLALALIVAVVALIGSQQGNDRSGHDAAQLVATDKRPVNQ